MDNPKLSYKNAGVNIDAGDRLVERIGPIARRTYRPEVMGGLGGFAALFDLKLPLERYRHPVLVSATDGVGTKLKLAVALQRHDTLGIDLVAMCVNDLLVTGAEPLFFLDYFATGHLAVDVAETVIRGIGEGCRQAGAALVGGETAEMPGVYRGDDYDLAGFAVGIVEKDRILDGHTIQPDDALIGIAASGPHSNGYSLIRKILETRDIDLTSPFEGGTLGDVLITPTRIYVKPLLSLIQALPVRALAHITGGGLVENLPRVLPADCQARIDPRTWPRPAIFDWLQTQGALSDAEMYRTFNCGIGMVVCVADQDVDACLTHLRGHHETAWRIGHIAPRPPTAPCVVIKRSPRRG